MANYHINSLKLMELYTWNMWIFTYVNFILVKTLKREGIRDITLESIKWNKIENMHVEDLEIIIRKL